MQPITVEVKGLELIRQPLGELSGEMPKIIRAGVNKGVKAARTEASKHITGTFTVKKKDLFTGAQNNKGSDKLKILLAKNEVFPHASLFAVGYPGMRYAQFKHSVTRRGVNVSMYRGRKATLKAAWKMRLPNSPAEGIFRRQNAGLFRGTGRKLSPRQYGALPAKYRKPVVHLRGFSAAQMLDEKDGVEKARKRGEEVFMAEVDRLIKKRLEGFL